jgi:TRAP-type C4-dicarboxylate transport system substrate-binding protein
MSRKKLFVYVISACVLSMLLNLFPNSNSALAEEPRILKFSHQWVQGDVRDRWAQHFISLVEERTKGTLKFQLYPAGTLFKPRTQIDALRSGALDFCVWHLGYSAGKLPALGLTDLPGLVPYPERGLSIAHSGAGKKLCELAESLGMKVIAWGYMPSSVGSQKSLIKVPDDVKGHKMRGGSKVIEMLFRNAGAAVTHVSSPEIYMALQRGVLDSVLTSDSSFISFRLFEVLKYFTISKQHGLMCATTNMVMSPKTFNSLNPDQQKIVMEAGTESEKMFSKELKKVTEDCERIYREKGIEIYELSDSELALWIDLSKKTVWKWFREKVKGGDELLDLALKAE